ncbi:MAG: TolC family protein [Brevinematales bacterium]
MSRLILFITILTFLSLKFYSLDIDTAIKIALENREELKILSNQIELQSKVVKSKFLNFFPVVLVGVENSKEAFYTINSNTYNMLSSLEINYSIYDSGYRFFETKAEQVKVDLLRLEFEQKRREIEYKTKAYFYDVLLYKNIVELRSNEVEKALSEKNKIETLYKEGLSDFLSFKTTEYYYNFSVLNYKSAFNSFVERLELLKNYLKINYDEIEVYGILIKEEKFLDYTNDLRIDYINKSISFKNYQLLKYISSLDWQVNFFFNLTGQRYFTDYSTRQRENYFYFGVKVYFPLFDWLSFEVTPNYRKDFIPYNETTIDTGKLTFLDYLSQPYYYDRKSLGGKIKLFDNNNKNIHTKEIILNYKKEVEELEAQMLEYRSEFIRIKEKFEELELGIFSASNMIELAKLNYEKDRILFENGKKTALDLLESKTKIIEAEVNYLKSIYEYNLFAWKIQANCD